MPFQWNFKEHLLLMLYFLKWLAVTSLLGSVIGIAVAVFLWGLDVVTTMRWNHPWLLDLLPVAGLGIGATYQYLGREVEAGNNLIVDQIHEPGGGGMDGVPLRMAPLVLIATLVTHLFGGSAGREGTAVQMGGSIAGTIGRWLRFSPQDIRVILMAGIAGGFGAVFGTPLTGAIFAIEVLAIGRISYEALVPCLLASIIGDWTTATALGHVGLHHTQYRIIGLTNAASVSMPRVQAWMLAKVAVAAVAFGLASVVFAELTHALGWLFKRVLPWPMVRPFVGGLAVIALVYLLGTRDFLGIGVTAGDPHHPDAVCIVSAFSPSGANAFSWWWKIVFTVITLGSGFKGGEVTPLFFVGATLGNTLAHVLHAPVDLFAGLGFVAVFAGATNTPLACTIMAIELFAPGSNGLFSTAFIVYAAEACCLAYLFSGHAGIYRSQRVGTPKLYANEATGQTRRHARG